MKKLVLVMAVVAFGFTASAQTNFGVKAGADFASMKAEAEGISVTASETGFYVGFFAEMEVSESFAFRPEVLYVSIEDSDQLSIPLMAKIGVSEEFSVLAGPSLGLMLDSDEGMKSLNFGLEAGVSYDFSEEFFIEARYNLGLANLLEDAPSGYSVKLSGFFAGLGYRF